MSRSKNERSLFDSQDRDVHYLPTNESYVGQQEQPGGMYGDIPPVDNYWAVQPQQYWDPYAGQVPYVSYLPGPYYPSVPPQYPAIAASPSSPVSKTPANKPRTAFPAAPLGRTPLEPIAAYPSMDIVPQPAFPIPVQQPVVSAMPMHPNYPPAPLPPPPPSYYYSHPPPSPYYARRRSPPPYHYYDRDHLP